MKSQQKIVADAIPYRLFEIQFDSGSLGPLCG